MRKSLLILASFVLNLVPWGVGLQERRREDWKEGKTATRNARLLSAAISLMASKRAIVYVPDRYLFNLRYTILLFSSLYCYSPDETINCLDTHCEL